MNNNKFIFLLILLIPLLLSGTTLLAGDPVKLEGIFNPAYLLVDDTQLYITQGVSVSIFSLTDYSLVATFGKAGEGPQEFKVHQHNAVPVFLDIQSDQILVSSMGKLSYFSKNGKFIREHRFSKGMAPPFLQPIGSNFVTRGFLHESKINYNLLILLDNGFNEIKRLAKQKNPYQPGQDQNPLERELKFRTDISCNHIIADVNNNQLEIFDGNGKRKFTIVPDIPKIKVTSAHKEEVLNFYRTSPQHKQYLNYMLKHMIFSSNLPMIRSFAAADGKIYIMTFHQKDKGQKTLCLVYGKDGKLINKKYIPFRFETFLSAYSYTIKNNTFYQLAENDDEEWVLYTTPIE